MDLPTAGEVCVHLTRNIRIGQLTIDPSDLVAELDFAQSGILKWENAMPFPDVQFMCDAGIPHVQVESYQSQLSLRTLLNSIHSDLYSKGKEKGEFVYPLT